MAESDKIKSTDIIDENLFTKQIQEAKEFASASQLVVVGLKSVYATQLELIKLKTPDDAKSIKEKTSALIEAEKVRKAILVTERQQIINQRELIKNEQQQTRTKKDLTEAEIKELGTLERLAYANRKLNEERKKLNLETDKGRLRLKDINLELDKNNLAIKDNNDALGKQRLNIGNYKSALEGLPAPMQGAVNGVRAFGNSLKALLLNPVILLLAAVTGAVYGLYKAFVSTDSGATELEARFEQLSAAMDVVRQRAVIMGQSLIEALKFNFEESTKLSEKAINGIGAALKTATEAAYRYTFAIDKIEDSENNYISKRAENERAISKLEFNAADKSFTIKQRRDFLEQAIKLSEEEAEREKGVATKRLAVEARYLADKAGLTFKETIEFITLSDKQQADSDKKIVKARDNFEKEFVALENYYKNVVDADKNFYDENKKNNGKLTAFDEQINADAKVKRDKKLAEEKKRLEESTYNYKKQLEEKQKAAKDFPSLEEGGEFKQRQINLSNYTTERNRLIAEGLAWEKSEKERKQAETEQLEKQTTAFLKTELDRRNSYRLNALNAEISEDQRKIDRQFQLAKDGKDNQLAWEEQRLAKDRLEKQDAERKAAKQREAILLAEAYLNAFNAELKKDGANPTTAASKALGSVLLARGIASGLAAVLDRGFDGTEDTGAAGNIDSQGGKLWVLHPNERVVSKANNDKMKGLSNDKLTDIAVKYNSGELVDVSKKYQLERPGSFSENVMQSMLINEFSKYNRLLEEIADKPSQHVAVDSLGNLIETVYARGRKDIIIHKQKRI